jgi:hypothetical protein
LAWKPQRNRLFGRHGHRWKDNIKLGINEIGWLCMDRIHLGLDRDRWRAVVNMVTNS